MAASVAQPGAVRMFEATVGGALSSDPECKAKPSVSACKVGAELQFGVDFISTASGKKVVIIPLKPLKAGNLIFMRQRILFKILKVVVSLLQRPMVC